MSVSKESLDSLLESISATGAQVTQRKHYTKVGGFLSIHSLKSGLRVFVTEKAVTNGAELTAVNEKTHSGKFKSYTTVTEENLDSILDIVKATLAASPAEEAAAEEQAA